MIPLGGRSCRIFSLSLVSPWSWKGYKNVSEWNLNRAPIGKHLSDMFPITNGVLKKNKKCSVFASREIWVEVNADKTKYMVISWDQNAGWSQNIKTDNSSFKRVVQFKHLGTTIMNQNSIQEQIKRRLKCGNAYYHSEHNLLFSSLLTYILTSSVEHSPSWEANRFSASQ